MKAENSEPDKFFPGKIYETQRCRSKKLRPKLIGSRFRVQGLPLFEPAYHIDKDSEYPTSPIG
jgi:hypothetical protein